MLTIIFNQSLVSCQVPDDWKDANVVPLHKKGKRDSADNYRPVSLTCIASKILEHIIYSSVAQHLEKNSILTSGQHGFRSGHSCETQLAIAVNDWAKAMDSNHCVDVAILDFCKAFDSVPHERLKSKLHFVGVRGKTLQWISSFLSERRQRVLLNGTCSDWSNVRSGVPQGSVLGPLLFLIYINDIGRDIGSTIRLFADDCIVYRVVNNILDVSSLQNDLDKLVKWGNEWQMEFNVKKCSVMHLSRKRQKMSSHYFMNGVQLKPTNCATYLGVEIQDDLGWGKHIDKITGNASRTLGLIRRNLWGCSKQTKSLAFTSLVRPQIEYACTVWDPYLIKHVRKLDMIQRRGARFVVADYRYTSSPSEMINKLQWPSLTLRRQTARLGLLYKAIHGAASIPLDGLQKPIRATRKSDSLSYINLCTRSDSYKYSFFPRTIVDWNNLPYSVRSSSSVDSFKLALGQFYALD
jgi:hypothetical protein